MDEKSRLHLQKMIAANDVEDQTPLIRQLKHSTLIQNDINNLLLSGEYNFFFTRPIVNKELLMDTQFLSETKNIIKKIKETDFTADNIKNSLWDFATVNSRQKVLWPLRVSLTGQKKSPDPFTVAAIIGKEETLTRIDQALALQ